MSVRNPTPLLRTFIGVAVVVFFGYCFYRRGVDGTFDFMTREECLLPAVSGLIVYGWLRFGPRFLK